MPNVALMQHVRRIVHKIFGAGWHISAVRPRRQREHTRQASTLAQSKTVQSKQRIYRGRRQPEAVHHMASPSACHAQSTASHSLWLKQVPQESAAQGTGQLSL